MSDDYTALGFKTALHDGSPCRKAYVWKMLLQRYDLAQQAGGSFDLAGLRAALFIHFDVTWNSVVNLVLTEIDLANECHFGHGIDADDRERAWKLAGYDRTTVLGGQRTQPARYAGGPPDWGRVVGDQPDPPEL